MFEKPSEAVMFRPTSYGGLGVLCPKFRALACLIRSFLETAANPSFRRNLFHEQLFRFHIMLDRSIPNPGFPPYYPPDFFRTIRNAKDDTSINITSMTTSQWSTFLVEENVTKLKISF